MQGKPQYVRLTAILLRWKASSQLRETQRRGPEWKSALLLHPGRSLSLDQTGTAFGIEPAHTACRSGARRPARFRDTLPLFETFGHALESHFAVRMLRPAFRGRHHNSTRTMNQPYALLNLITVLSTRPAGNEVFYIAIAFQRCAVGWIGLSHGRLFPHKQ